MSSFAYTARDSSGSPVSGLIAAASIADAGRLLRAEGKYPTAVHPASTAAGAAGAASSGGPIGRSGLSIPRADVVQISTQLAIMLETGVTLAEALECIAAQLDKPKTRRLVEDLNQQVQSGVDFSTALGRHPRTFPRLFIALIRAAERSGMMGKMLTRGSSYLRDEQETLRRIKGALTYPAIMLAFALTTTIFLLAFVLPRFSAIYANKGAALPMPTKILMTMSDFIVAHWLSLLIGLGVSSVLGFFYFRADSGRRLWHFMQLHVPVFGPLFRKIHLSRGLRMLGTMAGAGVQLVDCVATVQDLCANTYFRGLWQDVSEQIHDGKQLSDPMFHSNLVPRSVAQMLHSGEKSGKLAYVLEQIAGYSEQELKESIANLTRYIEPCMIIVMGCIIGGVAMAMLLPIFTISRVVAH